MSHNKSSSPNKDSGTLQLNLVNVKSVSYNPSLRKGTIIIFPLSHRHCVSFYYWPTLLSTFIHSTTLNVEQELWATDWYHAMMNLKQMGHFRMKYFEELGLVLLCNMNCNMNSIISWHSPGASPGLRAEFALDCFPNIKGFLWRHIRWAIVLIELQRKTSVPWKCW